MSFRNNNGFCDSGWLWWLTVLLFMSGWARHAYAHSGPPFPIMENRQVGPVVVSIWANPDVGTGSFFVLVSALPGKTVPQDLKVQIGVQPISGRLSEAVYDAWRQDLRDQIEYKVIVPFDRQETWRIHLILSSTEGKDDASTDVAVTPSGFGRWDLLLYALPFLGVGLLCAKAISVKRSRGKMRVSRP